MKQLTCSIISSFVAACLLLGGCKNEPTLAEGSTATAEEQVVRKTTPSGKTQIRSIKSAKGSSSAPERTGAVAGAGTRGEDARSTEPEVLVYGTVTRTDGAAAAGVTVGLHGVDMAKMRDSSSFDTKQAVASVETDADGKYELRGPIIMGMHLQVRGDTPPVQAVLEHNELYEGMKPRPGLQRIKKDIKLLPGHSLSGSVQNERGEAMAGLPVHLKPKWEQNDQRLFKETETTTTAAGTFALEQVAPGAYLVGTVHPDYAAVTETITVPTTGPLVLSLGARGGTVSGHVYHKDTGGAAAGINMALAQSNPFELNTLQRFETKSAGDGSFRFDHVSSGTKRLVVSTEDKKLGMALPMPSPIAVGEKETTDVTVFVYPGHTITGRVFDKDTQDPLSGAVVRLGSNHRNVGPESIADSDGNYRLENIFPSQAAQVRLTADLEGFEPEGEGPYNTELSVKLSEERYEESRDVPMVKTVKISGIVVTKDKVPVPHAAVTLYNNRTHSSSNEKVAVNADGTFEAYSLPFVSVVIEATASGYGPALSDTIEVATLDIADIKLVMDVGAVVQGVVLDPDGEPLEGAKVTEARSYGLTTTYREKAVSGKDGQYSIANLQKQVVLKASKEGYADSEELHVAVRPGETKTGADITLRQGHTIAGRVVDTSGNPVKGASVNAHGSGLGSAHKQVEDDGRFELAGLAEGAYRVYASGGGHGYVQKEGVKTGTLDLELVMGKTPEETGDGIKFIGTVVDDLSGDPVRDFEVTENSSSLKVRKLSETGKFELVGVRKNYGYNLKISSPDYMEQEFSTNSSNDGSDVEQTFRIGKGGAIVGRVVEKATGKPLPNIVVVNWGNTQYYERGRKGPRNHTTTDDEGQFTLAPAPTGKNTVQPKPTGGYSEVVRSVEVKSEEIADVGDIELTKGGSITGIVVRGQSEEPVAGQNISLSAWSQDLQVSKKTSTDDAGSFEFTNLPAMTYTVSADSTRKSVELAEDGTADVKLVLGGVTVKGTVTRGGVPVRASISGTGPDGIGLSTYTQSGDYVIKNVVPGTYEFRLHPQTNSNTLEETVEVPDKAEFVKDFQFPDGRIVVNVVNAAGEPVAGADVSVSQKSSNTGFDQRWLTRTMGNQRSDTGGQAEFTGLSEGTYSVSGRKDGVGTAIKPDIQVSTAGPTEVQLQLSSEGGTLMSVALSYATGQGVPEAWCYLHGENGPFTHAAKRDASGVMVINNIPPGTYITNVSYWSHSQSEKQVEIKANETVNIEDVLYPAGALHWTLKKADGSPAKGATVTVTPVTTEPPEEPRNGAAGENGLFVQRGLAGGTYQVTAQLPGKTAVTETFIVAAGANEQKETTVPGW